LFHFFYAIVDAFEDQVPGDSLIPFAAFVVNDI
jgi:hypothetical protein